MVLLDWVKAHWLRLVVHVGSWIPLAWMLWAYWQAVRPDAHAFRQGEDLGRGLSVGLGDTGTTECLCRQRRCLAEVQARQRPSSPPFPPRALSCRSGREAEAGRPERP